MFRSMLQCTVILPSLIRTIGRYGRTFWVKPFLSFESLVEMTSLTLRLKKWDFTLSRPPRNHDTYVMTRLSKRNGSKTPDLDPVDVTIQLLWKGCTDLQFNSFEKGVYGFLLVTRAKRISLLRGLLVGVTVSFPPFTSRVGTCFLFQTFLTL